MTQNQENKTIAGISDYLKKDGRGMDITGVSGAERAYIVSSLYNELKTPFFIVTSTQKQAEKFYDDLRFFGRHQLPLMIFPQYNILPFKMLSYHSETAATRIRILYRFIADNIPPVVIIPVGALLQNVIPKKELCDFAELVMAGEDIDRDRLIEKMVSGGYTRTAIVEEPGDFCIRGGIMDVFSPMYDDPLRIELFGDTVDSLRFFSAATQRKTEIINEAVLLPAKEAVLRKEDVPDVVARARKQAFALEIRVTAVREVVEKIKSEGIFPGMESLLPLIYPDIGSLFDYLPSSTRFVLLEPGEIEMAAEEFNTQAENNFLKARSEGNLCIEPERLYWKWPDAEKNIQGKNHIVFKLLPVSTPLNDMPSGKASLNLSVNTTQDISGKLINSVEKENLLLPLAEWIKTNKDSGNLTLIMCGTPSQAGRIISLMEPYEITMRSIDMFPDVPRNRGMVYTCIGQISSGFVWGDASLAIITEDEIFGQKKRRKKTGRKQVKAELLGLEDLKKGDLVVHEDHGIGQYQGLEKLEIENVSNDFLLILYKDNDRLYLPVDRMNMVKKYIGVDGINPVLDKMGGQSWEKVKAKTRKEVEKIAGELLSLYAERKVGKGHAFGEADRYFRDFEAGFQYEETPDQIKAIDDVLDDMEKPEPMDRLICGDVGYGKTEIALRASFKAVSDSKQVAVLVPTTVLAEQHYKTFSDRFKQYPITIAGLSRFRTRKEQSAILNDLKSGKLDIIIGTHRLLQKDVAFKDPGLIIIDEEQRFGVKHKEKLKTLRKTVDVLALTATPIPRTLHMSLMGIRDISVISTPPEERHAIITYISEIDDTVITEAIRKELKRNGQIFFIHNTIHSIRNMAKHLKQLVPEVRLDVAHGRMDENELEDVMLRFINRETDMLVCTTIVESGLDIPSANTILINRADRFGLAQMYQLRGRVGRSDEQAYAYLFIPRESALAKDAQKRLKVLMEHSDLGSGFQIAMSDLQIRGGGSALGVSQSGRIAAVGYDMFLQLMENAIAELKGEPVVENLDPEINIPLSAFIPETYVPDIDQRLTAYRRLAKMNQPDEIKVFKDELADRYGPLPAEVNSLLIKITLKVFSIQAGIKRLDLSENRLFLYISAEHQKQPFGIIDMITDTPDVYQLTPEHVLKITLHKGNTQSALSQTKNILKEIARRVNP